MKLSSLRFHPSPIWTREMRQQARIGRTPWVLLAFTVAVTMLMSSVGGMAASTDSSPATIGGGLFQTFFSVAYFVVVLLGPAVAANAIAAEREGRTWEAVLLAGLTPESIARGKFLAAYTIIGLYVVVLAPVGALAFLFGGVTATEVVVAFVFLFLLAALAVAFGLAVSSVMNSLRAALIVTVLLAATLGPALWGIGGFGGSVLAHGIWPEMPMGSPVWLPIAYGRADFGLEYALFLFALPLLLIGLPAWFLYEVTVANLSGPTDDRSTGLKRWFAAGTPLLTLGAAAPLAFATSDPSRMVIAMSGVTFIFGHAVLAAMLFSFDSFGPSRRVRVHWDRAGTGALRRFFGPGLVRTSVLVVALGAMGMTGVAGIGAFARAAFGSTLDRTEDVAKLAAYTFYAVAFFVFVAGLLAFVRSRGGSPWTARVVTSAVILVAAALPWVVAAVAGLLLRGSSDEPWLAVAAPSPLYAFRLLSIIGDADAGAATGVAAGLFAAGGWGLLGFVLLGLAARRCSRSVAEHAAAHAATEAAMAAEEAAMAVASATHGAPGADEGA